jgi:hypothetical protein
VGGFKGEWASSSAVARGDSDEDDEDGAKIQNWHMPFRGGGMGAFQNEKLRMLLREGVVFGKGGKMSVGSLKRNRHRGARFARLDPGQG